MLNTGMGRASLWPALMALCVSGCGSPQRDVNLSQGTGNATESIATPIRTPQAQSSHGELKPGLLSDSRREFVEVLPEEYFRPPALEESKAGFKSLAAQLVLQAELDESGKDVPVASNGRSAP